MKRKKFLTVMACFDDETQSKLKKMRLLLSGNGIRGSETADIPYHVSLGSFPVKKLNELKASMEKEAETTRRFCLTFNSFADFGGRVLYLRPEKSDELMSLHSKFGGNYADGLDFVPHATLLISDETAVARAKEILGEPQKITAEITYLLLGKFFPAEYLHRCELKK